MATKVANKNKETRFENLKATTQKINKDVLNFSDNLVEETLATSSEWQNVFAKALKNGTILLGNQQDLVFDTLEAVKSQYVKGNTQFRRLLSLGGAKKTKAAKNTKNTTKKASNNLDAQARLDKIAKKVAEADLTVTGEKKSTIKVVIEKSNLKVIEGVGPKLESVLNEGGILTFEQLANAKVEAIKVILEKAGSRYKMHDPTTWGQQANLAAAGKMDELKAFQAELKGGRLPQ